MPPLPPPSTSSDQDASKPQDTSKPFKKTTLETILSDIEDGTVNFGQLNSVQSIAAPEMELTSRPGPNNTEQAQQAKVGCKRKPLADLAASDEDLAPPSKRMKSQPHDEKVNSGPFKNKDGITLGRRKWCIKQQAASLKRKKQEKKQHEQLREQERTRPKDRSFVPVRFWDSVTQRYWKDCHHCLGMGRKSKPRLWHEHDQVGENKRVDEHYKQIKVKCLNCKVYYKY